MLSREQHASPKSHGDPAIPGLYNNCLKQAQICSPNLDFVCMLGIWLVSACVCLCACVICVHAYMYVFMCVKGNTGVYFCISI